jgi:chemotaxis protein CheC
MNAEGFPVLSAFELDALAELVNYGVSRAAVALREMVREQVHLSVPEVRVVTRTQAVEILHEREDSGLVAVHQTFEGAMNGRALLIFPDANSLELVRAVTGGDLPLEDIMELEQEALAETGNVILNNCVATIANMLKCTFKMSLPEILRGEGPELFNLPPAPEAGDVVMFLYINFSVHERKIRGYIAILMDVPSVIALKQLLNQFIERTTGVLEPQSDARY